MGKDLLGRSPAVDFNAVVEFEGSTAKRKVMVAVPLVFHWEISLDPLPSKCFQEKPRRLARR